MEYQFSSFQNTVCDFVEKWNAYNVLCKVENDNIILTYRFKMIIFVYLNCKDYSIFCIDIHNILFLHIFFQQNSINTWYVCVQLIKFIYIYIYLYGLSRMKFY